ncbi:MAG: hypothetical protein H6766_01140 [Candidatus Peribacteria bacterium]|nr:MAG: hypothetical protein H6766_01140 [Candidatus Peribacteria bacterium]
MWRGTADYRPFDLITREEAAKFMVEFAINVLCRKPTYTYTNQFIDIEGVADPSLIPYIKESYEYVIFHGDGGGASHGQPTTFRPKDMISVDEMMAVLVRLVTNDYNEAPGEDWAQYYRDFMDDHVLTPLVDPLRNNTANTIYDLYKLNEYRKEAV